MLKGKAENPVVDDDCDSATRLLEVTSKVFDAVWNL